ncbi:hypothetical protein [Allocoleopsis franciscana]|uniref:hypothetical protein n=1 Tax=Allocoleopsis franciscana TaxID=2886352 RepID=UPI00030EF533|nr:hypothetical protein [Allocoleopsis franciscana]
MGSIDSNIAISGAAVTCEQLFGVIMRSPYSYQGHPTAGVAAASHGEQSVS